MPAARLSAQSPRIIDVCPGVGFPTNGNLFPKARSKTRFISSAANSATREVSEETTISALSAWISTSGQDCRKQPQVSATQVKDIRITFVVFIAGSLQYVLYFQEYLAPVQKIQNTPAAHYVTDIQNKLRDIRV
jgi:hypothetical protein